MFFYGMTDKGKIRKVNQDVYQTYFDEAKQTTLLIVCDGMGGAKAGNIASAIAADTFMDVVKSQMAQTESIIDIMNSMTTAVRDANEKVYDKSQNDSACAGMGTTLVAAAVTPSGTVIANIGDSRAYHVTAGAIKQISKDHSVIEDMIDRGDLTRLEATSHPSRNLITRALGTSAQTEPDFFVLSLGSGDALLLCSDGLSNVISDQVMLSEISKSTDVQAVCQSLINLAINNGAPDNVTAVLYFK